MTTCRHCIMDAAEDNVIFENGCTHCYRCRSRMQWELHPDKFNEAISKIKTSAIGRHYDCLIGLSGGLDSSYVAYLLVKAGLKPYAITLDNDWDTDIAKHNVKMLVEGLGLHHEVIRVDRGQYKDVQFSLLKASVKNAEAITDHIIIAKMYEYANKLGLKYIVHGGNIVTEAIMPKSWGYTAMDWRQLKGIHRQFGTGSIKGLPHMNLWNWFDYTFIKRIKWFPILNYTDYNISKAAQTLYDEYGWKPYGHKHMENRYTRFFQGYILPKKFGIDKRKAHFSTLICSKQMTRQYALKVIEEEYYRHREMMIDKHDIAKYFDLTEAQFDKLIEQPGRSHLDFPNNDRWFKRLSGLVEFSRKVAVSA